MATCGIKKYDNLPSRVGWIDVDYLRWALSLNTKQREKIIIFMTVLFSLMNLIY